APVESEPNDTVATANDILVNSQTAGTLDAHDVDVYKVTLTESGRLTVEVHAAGFPTRLSLLGPDGELLIQSDGQSATDRDDRIVQYLAGAAGGTSYYLRVEGLDGGTGAYTLTTEFVPAVLPFQPLPVGDDPQALVTADFNGDGHPDLVTLNGPFPGTIS